jgi:hypothetical protein
VLSRACGYQLFAPWHVLQLVPPAVRFTVPFMCVAAFAVVLLYPEPWHEEHEMPLETCSEWRPLDGGTPWQLPHDCAGGVYVQACERTGVPPVQPDGEDAATVRVCVPFDWQAPHAE